MTSLTNGGCGAEGVKGAGDGFGSSSGIGNSGNAGSVGNLSGERRLANNNGDDVYYSANDADDNANNANNGNAMYNSAMNFAYVVS